MNAFNYRDDPRPSVMVGNKNGSNQHTVGRRVNLKTIPGSSFNGPITSRAQADKTNSIKRTK